MPCTSPSFHWSVQDLVSSAGKRTVYILAEKETAEPNVMVSESDSNDGSSQSRHSYTFMIAITKFECMTDYVILLSFGILYTYICIGITLANE